MTVYRGQPDRDLQAYFQTNASYDYMYAAHTGVSAITKASPTGLTLTGTFHDQFDWGVIEWNRDNQYEHLALRNVPNGDFTGLTFAWTEKRSANCVQLDSTLYDWQDWSRLRIFCGKEVEPRRVLLKTRATPGADSTPATLSLQMSGGTAIPGMVYVIDITDDHGFTDRYDCQVPNDLPYRTGSSFKMITTAPGQEFKVSFTGPDYTHTYQYFSTAAWESVPTPLAALMNSDPNCPVVARCGSDSDGAVILEFHAKGITGGAYQFSCWNRDHFEEQSAGNPWFDWVDAKPETIPPLFELRTSAGVVNPPTISGDTITFTAVSAARTLTAHASVIDIIFGTGFGAAGWVAVTGAPATTSVTKTASPLVDTWDFSVTFDANLKDIAGDPVPLTDIRAIRWTYCPKLVNAPFSPLDYTVEWSNYSVTGTGATNKFAGQYSRIIHCEDREVAWTGYYEKERGNFVGGAIAFFDHTSTSVTIKYNCPKDHELYVGSRFLDFNGTMKVTVDEGTPQYFDLFMTKSDIGWDRVCRLKVGSLPAGKHTVVVTSKGETSSDKNPASTGWRIFFNYLQAVVLADEPDLTVNDNNDITLATDWDTAHSLELSPQRVIWNLRTLGFKGRTNHYLGALKWYRLKAVDGTMATGSFQIGVTPNFATAKSWGEGIGLKIDGLRFDSYIKSGFTTLNDVANDFISQINAAATSVWASLDGSVAGKIIVHARRRSGGTNEPNGLVLEAVTAAHLTITTSGSLSGGVKYNWVVDRDATEPVNAATIAWTQSYLETLHSYSMSAVLALSQELAHEPKDSPLAAKYSDGQAVWLNTPALQTAFRPETRDYFKVAFQQIAQVMVNAGVQPFLQFGECQWWYFATRWDTTMPVTPAGDYWQTASSLGVYDSYTTGQFASRYGGTMHVFKDDYDRATPGGTKRTTAQVKADYPHECELLSSLIGEYTSAIIDYVKATVPTCKFEVLYPLDVNDGSVPNNINQPPAIHWGSAKLDAFKTEGFGYMFSKNLAQIQQLIKYPFAIRNFSRANSRCLLGSYDNNDPFERALMEATAEGVGDKVLWAFDQFAMRSFRLPLYKGEAYTQIVTW